MSKVSLFKLILSWVGILLYIFFSITAVYFGYGYGEQKELCADTTLLRYANGLITSLFAMHVISCIILILRQE